VHGLCQTYHRLMNRFGPPDGLLGDEAQVEAHLVYLEIVLILTRDRCSVCVERTIGSKIVLDALEGTHRSRASHGISFRCVWTWCLCWCKIGAQFAQNVP
jgi:hypothetical protein